MKRRNFIQLIATGLILPNITWANVANKKILIAYYTRTQNTFIVADFIQKNIGGDLFAIQTTEEYPSHYQETVNISKKQIEKNIQPQLKNNIDISAYEIIFIGSPIWNGHIAPPVVSFMANKPFQGKKIYPFFTHAGYGVANAPDDIKTLLGFNYHQHIGIKTNAERDNPNILKTNQNLIQNNQQLTAIKNIADLEKWIKNI